MCLQQARICQARCVWPWYIFSHRQAFRLKKHVFRIIDHFKTRT